MPIVSKDPSKRIGPQKASGKLAFHGATPVVQRSGSAQAAVTATTIAAASGTYTKAEVDAVITRVNALTTLVNELQAALVEKGLIKGSA